MNNDIESTANRLLICGVKGVCKKAPEKILWIFVWQAFDLDSDVRKGNIVQINPLS